MPKKKRTLSPEHYAKLKAGRERALAAKNIEIDMDGVLSKIDQMPHPQDVILDVTRDNLISESDLIERIRRMFDDSNMPTLLKVNSKQLLEILDVSNRWSGYTEYASPFGDITVQVVPAKDIQ